MSHQALKKLKAQMNFIDDELTFFGGTSSVRKRTVGSQGMGSDQSAKRSSKQEKSIPERLCSPRARAKPIVRFL